MENNTIEYLIYLVQVKNELNRKRRRFYSIWFYLSGNHYKAKNKKQKHKSFSVKSARAGYNKAKAKMKAMTKEMRRLRTELNFQFQWNDGGMITTVYEKGWHPYGDGKGKFIVIHHRDFKKHHDSHLAEQHLLS